MGGLRQDLQFALRSLRQARGSTPLIARPFGAADEPPAGPPVVVISEGLWRRRFAGDVNAIGSRITLSNTRYTIVGVMPAPFDFPLGVRRNAFWIPLDFRAF